MAVSRGRSAPMAAAALVAALAAGLAVVLAVSLGLGLAGCGLAGGDTVVSEDDDGAVIQVDERSTVIVELEGNPTTGYGWAPIQEPTFLEFEGEPTYEPGSDLIGAGGVYRFRYLVTGRGEGRLAFAYQRSFEETAPIETFEVELVSE